MGNVFVIIATYNGMEWLEKCLGSLRQSTVPVHTIVIDNGSTDNTIQTIEQSFPEIFLLENSENLGFGKANNLGIAYAMKEGADYVFLLNQDAWIFPNTIERLISIQKKNPEYLILSPMHLDRSEKALEHNFARWINSSQLPELSNGLFSQTGYSKQVYPAKFVNAALWLLSRKTIETIGVFDPIFHHYGEDVDYSNRVNYHGFSIGVCPGIFGVHDKIANPAKTGKRFSPQINKKRHTAYLIVSKNINDSLGIGLLKFGKLFVRRMMARIANRQFSFLLPEIKVAVETILKIKIIFRHRSISRTAGKSFLPHAAIQKSKAMLHRKSYSKQLIKAE